MFLINCLHCDFYLFGFYNNYIYSYNIFLRRLFKLFVPLEFKYNKLQFGIRISSIEVRKQKPCIATSLYVCNKTYSIEIHPGAIPFSRPKGFEYFSVCIGVCMHWCLYCLPQQKSFRNGSEVLEETLLDKSCELVSHCSPPPPLFVRGTV